MKPLCSTSKLRIPIIVRVPAQLKHSPSWLYITCGAKNTGVQCMRSPYQVQKFTNALHSYHIDKAIEFYTSNAAYSPHLARLLFQLSRLQTQTGDPSAKSTLHNAFAIRGRITSNGNRFAEELVEADFDELVGIWER